jgi:large repetitive protein
LTVSFEALLAPVITSGTVVLNQGHLILSGIVFGKTDDPAVPGDENPTETLISSAPLFEVLKISTIMEGDLEHPDGRRHAALHHHGQEHRQRECPERDLAGLHAGQHHYVAGSTTLNGMVVADAGQGINPLHAGILNAPGARCRALAGRCGPWCGNHTATLTFDVVVDPNVMDGLVICNQGFVSGSGLGSGPQPEQPSDDPATPLSDDPTCTLSATCPALRSQDRADPGGQTARLGIVDPGDVLRYTIVISNFSATPATGVAISDEVPAHTTYVADSAAPERRARGRTAACRR